MSEEEAEALGALIGIGLLCIVGLIVFLLPTLIAFGRGHHCKRLSSTLRLPVAS